MSYSQSFQSQLSHQLRDLKSITKLLIGGESPAEQISVRLRQVEVLCSPGKFPKMVDKNNIRESRYSRNPRIARALTEIGWVRELGEGVKRNYNEMEKRRCSHPACVPAGRSRYRPRHPFQTSQESCPLPQNAPT